MSNYDVTIIGAGIIGSATALELNRKGYSVAVIDRLNEPGLGSTSFSCAIVRCHYSTPTGVMLAHESVQYWNDFPGYLKHLQPKGLIEYRDVGVLVLQRSGNEIDQLQIKLMRDHGVEVEELNFEDLKHAYPYFNLKEMGEAQKIDHPDFDKVFDEDIPGAHFQPRCGYVNDPALATQNIAHAAAKEGVTFLMGSAVSAVIKANGRVSGVTLDNGDSVSSSIVINAAGPNSSIINTMAEVTLPLKLKPLRHEVHFVEMPADAVASKFPVVTDTACGVYFRGEPPTGILVGSLDPVCDELEFLTDPDQYNEQPTQEMFQTQVMRLMKRWPNIRLGTKSGFGALYDATPEDWYPIFDKSDLPGYYMAVGTSGAWFKGASPIGLIMAELVDYVEKGSDHDSNPLRFNLKYTGKEINVGFFSRNRAPHTSSMSVLG